MTNLTKELPQPHFDGFYTFNYITRDKKHELVCIKKENLLRFFFENNIWVLQSVEEKSYTIDLNFEDGLRLIQTAINGPSQSDDDNTGWDNIDWDNIFEDELK